jgi:hypothetical protein
MKPVGDKRANDFTNYRVLILVGKHAGREGVCVGRSADGKRWAISPDGADEILQLEFEQEFGLLIDASGDPNNN